MGTPFHTLISNVKIMLSQLHAYTHISTSNLEMFSQYIYWVLITAQFPSVQMQTRNTGGNAAKMSEMFFAYDMHIVYVWCIVHVQIMFVVLWVEIMTLKE